MCCEYINHRLIKITDRALDVVFSRFRGLSFTLTLRQKPKGVPRKQRRITIQRESMHWLCGTPLCLHLKVIVNEKSINLEKTTSSVLSVIFINLWHQYTGSKYIHKEKMFSLRSAFNKNKQRRGGFWMSINSPLISP